MPTIFKVYITNIKELYSLPFKGLFEHYLLDPINMARMKIYYKLLYYVNRTILCFKISSKDTSF